MALPTRIVFGLILIGLLIPAGFAQQGHPLDGTWYGDWGPTPTHRNPVVVVIHYDGDALDGLINPGPDAIPIDVVTLDPSTWSVHIEASATNRAGESVRYVVDGKLEDLGLPNRSMTGTWRHGDTSGDFRITRN